MSVSTDRKTLDQKRAERAWEHTKDLKGDQAVDFSTVSKQICSRIMNAGLGPTLAFSDAKSSGDADRRNAHAKILQAIDEHLSALGIIRDGQVKEIVPRVMEGNAANLRRATDETLAFMGWIGRFAEARKPPKKKGEENDDDAE